MENTLKKLLAKHLKTEKLNFAKMILIACNAVEVFSADKANLHGEDKLKLALSHLPVIIKMSIDDGYITETEGLALQHRLETGADLAVHMIEVVVAVANNPTLANLEQQVVKCCK